MNRLYVKPAGDAVVRDPVRNGEALPPEGKYVPRTGYWLTRIRHGDVVEAQPPRPAKPEKPESEPSAPAKAGKAAKPAA